MDPRYTKTDKLPEINFNKYSHIKVVNNRLMVKLIPLDLNVSAGGIAMNSTQAKGGKAFHYAVVVRLGEGILNTDGSFIPLNYQIGDVVAFCDGSGADFKLLPEDMETRKFDDVRVIETPSIYFVDGSAKHLYVDVTGKAAGGEIWSNKPYLVGENKTL